MGSIYAGAAPTSTYAGYSGLDSFVEEGFRAYSSTWLSWGDFGTIADMEKDPTVFGGPHPECGGGYGSSYWLNVLDGSYSPCDWMHVNAITAMQVGSTERVARSTIG